MLPRPMFGILLASAAGVFWGSMSIAAQYLMEAVSFDAIDLASLRLAGAGVLLLALEALVLREDILAPFRDKKDRRDQLFYALGMLGIQLTFFSFDSGRQRRDGRAHRHDGTAFRDGLDRLCRTPRHHEGRMDFHCARHGGRFASRHERRLLHP